MNLNDLLDIVRNEKTYTKRIEELQSVEAKAKAATDQLTKAKDLDAALANAKRAEQSASDMLKDARAKYLSTLDDAQNDARHLVEQAQESANKIISAVSDKKNELDSLTQQLEAVVKEHDAYQRGIATAKAELANITAQSQQLHEDVKKKAQQLKDLLSA